MKHKKGLVILHIDGLSFEQFKKGLDQGYMPYTKKLMESEGYEVLRYRCGLPSTTSFVQAGILYGENKNIPSFRWWDKKAGVEVQFGPQTTFHKVAHRYFHKSEPLTKNGACIATCFPGGAKQTFALAYRRRVEHSQSKTMRLQLITRWLINPFHILDWLYYSMWIILRLTFVYLYTKLTGGHLVFLFVMGDLMNELFLHHITRFATGLAMKGNYPIIYAAFYAYDETAHAFSPQHPFSTQMLFQVDRTIKYIATKRNPKNEKFDYELLVLSDHGQVATIPLHDVIGKGLREKLAEFLPHYRIHDMTGQSNELGDRIDGHIEITYSGAIAHIYFIDVSWRLTYQEIQKKFPKLISKILKIQGIEGMLVRDGQKHLFITQKHTFVLGKKLSPDARKYLSQYDDPTIVAKQLIKLNDFETVGDIILFGAFQQQKQVNFEDQAGGHGGMGGEQGFPFIMGKKEWNLKTDQIYDATQVYSLLKKLKNKIQKTS